MSKSTSRTALRYSYEGVSLKYRPALFTQERFALSSAARCVKPHRVVMGLVGEFLLVCNADAMRLARAGFEVIA